MKHISSVIALLLAIWIPVAAWAEPSESKRAILEQVRDFMLTDSTLSESSPLIARLDSILDHSDIQDDVFCHTMNGCGRYFSQQGRSLYLISFYYDALRISENSHEIEDPIAFRGRLYLAMGAAHEESGMQTKAMEFYMNALECAEQRNDSLMKGMLFNNIGVIYFKKRVIDKAVQNYQQAIEINEAIGQTNQLLLNYNNLSGVYEYTGELDTALDWALRATRLAEEQGDQSMFIVLEVNLASLYIKKGDFHMAESYLNAIDGTGQASPDVMGWCCLLRSQIAQLQDHPKQALAEVERGMALLGDNSTSDVFLDLLRLRVKVAQQCGLTNEALASCLQLLTLTDSLSSYSSLHESYNMEDLFNSDRRLRENELLIAQLSERETSNNFRLLLMSIIILCLAGGLIWFFTNNRQRKLEISEKQQLMSQMKETLDQRNRELTSHTLGMVEQKGFLNELKSDLETLQHNIPMREVENRQLSQQIINKIEKSTMVEVWEEFRTYFEQVHPSFYANLKAQYPDITVKDEHLCAFLRLGLTTKEIAALTFVEPRSVDSARNRLRKKLDIAPEVNLTEFLSKF